MSDFISKTDYDATIHAEILDALVRTNEATIETCEDAAIMEMKAYLNKRYDVNAIFSKRGDERHALILMYAKDIAVYHMFCVHNPYKMSSIRKDRYERALTWLKAVAEQDINIDGADMLPTEEINDNSPWRIESDPFHATHY